MLEASPQAPLLQRDPVAQPELQMFPVTFPLPITVSDSVGSQPWQESGREAAGSFPEPRRPQPLKIASSVGRLQAHGLDTQQAVSIPGAPLAQHGSPGTRAGSLSFPF